MQSKRGNTVFHNCYTYNYPTNNCESYNPVSSLSSPSELHKAVISIHDGQAVSYGCRMQIDIQAQDMSVCVEILCKIQYYVRRPRTDLDIWIGKTFQEVVPNK